MKNINHITVSIVSHRQFNLLLPLLNDLRDCKSLKKIILTINIDEEIVKKLVDVGKIEDTEPPYGMYT